MGKHRKVSETVENCPRLEMWKTRPKNTAENGNFSPTFLFFGHFSPISDRGHFTTVSHFFCIVGVRPVFHCVPIPHDCQSCDSGHRFQDSQGQGCKAPQRALSSVYGHLARSAPKSAPSWECFFWPLRDPEWPQRNRHEASITWCDLFWPKFGQKMPKIISLHDVLEPLKQALLASRDVIVFLAKFAAPICKKFSH